MLEKHICTDLASPSQACSSHTGNWFLWQHLSQSKCSTFSCHFRCIPPLFPSKLAQYSHYPCFSMYELFLSSSWQKSVLSCHLPVSICSTMFYSSSLLNVGTHQNQERLLLLPRSHPWLCCILKLYSCSSYLANCPSRFLNLTNYVSAVWSILNKKMSSV